MWPQAGWECFVGSSALFYLVPLRNTSANKVWPLPEVIAKAALAPLLFIALRVASAGDLTRDLPNGHKLEAN